MNTKNLLLLLSAIAATTYGLLGQRQSDTGDQSETAGSEAVTLREERAASRGGTDDAAIDRIFADRAEGVQIEGRGKVVKVLHDDNEGSRHQRFLLRIPSGLTLLVAHNIDLAPRIHDLREGDTIEFYGVYEWTEKGGLVHWTHHDPAGRHAAGWLKRNDTTYQ